jgi:hypothetical protein
VERVSGHGCLCVCQAVCAPGFGGAQPQCACVCHCVDRAFIGFALSAQHPHVVNAHVVALRSASPTHHDVVKLQADSRVCFHFFLAFLQTLLTLLC